MLVRHGLFYLPSINQKYFIFFHCINKSQKNDKSHKNIKIFYIYNWHNEKCMLIYDKDVNKVIGICYKTLGQGWPL